MNLLPQTNQGGPAKAEWELLMERRSVLVSRPHCSVVVFFTIGASFKVLVCS